MPNFEGSFYLIELKFRLLGYLYKADIHKYFRIFSDLVSF